MSRAKGSRPGSGYPAGEHVAVAFICPSNDLIVRIGRNFGSDELWVVWPSATGKSNERPTTRTWVAWSETGVSPQQSARSVTLRCFTHGTEDRCRVQCIQAVLSYLHDRGEPVELRLTKARFDDVCRRLAAR